ncbi:MAG: leucine--tRNA ligase [Bacteroidaceae bacterium]|nr:leucine--tRNA ligase [Bacteroidaceae bacterium]
MAKEYNFREIEQKWHQEWVKRGTYRVKEDKGRKKFYVLNMFPYPSGAGLHVGHPLGYIASDIYARYKRLQGFNVLNPMGYDAYGLPAEQYAIKTGQHPEKTTFQNIDRYREQLDRMGFSFDWDREVRTCSPDYYHWTQWAFQRMFEHFFGCPLPTSPKGEANVPKARPIEELTAYLEKYGTEGLDAYGVAQGEDLNFSAEEWKGWDEKKRSDVLMNYRLAFLGETMVNWCPALGTVLANDEVVNGVSERGGYPVEQKKMRQWCLRVSAYSQRLLDGLETIDWSESIKETQRNWIGRSEGAEIEIKAVSKKGDSEEETSFTIFTTRADTMFGVTFFVLAPESELVDKVTTPEQRKAVDEYIKYVKSRTERERMIDHTVTGVFSGAYGINPITGDKCPIYVAEYVLAGYGTGAIMAVPAHDSRDYAFAKHFDLPIIPLIEGADVSQESYDAKEGVVMNSPISPEKSVEYDGESLCLNGLSIKEAIAETKRFVKAHKLGRVKVNYRLRDAIFSRQRYWGEPFPVYYKKGIPTMIPEECLPIQLPHVESFLPTETGEPPLGNATKWAWDEKNRKIVDKNLIDEETVFPIELYTMPGFAGSSAYYLRYMDPHNDKALVSDDAAAYWQNVDLYVGGSEHATGHLIYSRFWNKFLFDLGVSKKDEPFQKLINQGMIQGWSSFVYRLRNTNKFVSFDLLEEQYDEAKKKSLYYYQGTEADPVYADISMVNGNVLNVEKIRQWAAEFRDAEFILNGNGQYIVSQAIEKMSKSKYNVVNPDDICENYGADTLRLYEMFLGPIEQSKPWDVAGIDGCFRFLKKFWQLFWDKDGSLAADDSEATAENMKTLHKLIKKVTADIESFSYNTSVAAFMVAVNELSNQKCRSRQVLSVLPVLIAPFAPHIAEELWEALGNETSVCDAKWPAFDEKYLVESSVRLGVQFNGKVKFSMDFPVDATPDEMVSQVMAADEAQRFLNGMQVVKTIAVPKRIVNIVVKPKG